MTKQETLKDILDRAQEGRVVTHAAEDLMIATRSLAQASEALRRLRTTNR